MAHIGYFPPEDFAVRKIDPGDMLVRSLLVAAVFLSLWFSFHPFASLAVPLDVTEEGDLANQFGYSALFVLLAAWCLLHQPSRLLFLLRPVLIVTLLWFALSVVMSWDPSLSARRLAFALITIGIAAMVLLLPKNPRHFSDVMAAVVMIVLVACYLGVIFMPSLSIHQATDALEPELAGDWRGVFGHKNEASAVMVLFVFIGFFVARMRSFGLGALIVALALPFLYFTNSRTAMAAMLLAYAMSVIVAHARRPALGIALSLSIMVALNVLSIGPIYFAPLHALIDQIMPDPTFSGRTDIWKFAMDHVAQRPITGYGFSAFWGTEQVVYGMSGVTWANTASHAHNGYLDLALTIGIPGSALVTLWLMVLPLVDFYRAPSAPASVPLQMLFLRICLFAAYESCFETMFVQVGALWLILIVAAFGMRFLAVSRAAD